jgi:hypothetical protein
MSRRPTPETDAAVIPLNGDYVVWHGFARRMECARDEAREALIRIEEIFIDGEDTYEDWKKMGNIARDHLKGLWK